LPPTSFTIKYINFISAQWAAETESCFEIYIYISVYFYPCPWEAIASRLRSYDATVMGFDRPSSKWVESEEILGGEATKIGKWQTTVSHAQQLISSLVFAIKFGRATSHESPANIVAPIVGYCVRDRETVWCLERNPNWDGLVQIGGDEEDGYYEDVCKAMCVCDWAGSEIKSALLTASVWLSRKTAGSLLGRPTSADLYFTTDSFFLSSFFLFSFFLSSFLL